MTDFEALKRQAKEREEAVRKVFVNYDHDKSDSIDMMELTCLLDDLGLYEKIKTDKTTFVAEMFAEFDKNGDGVLSFEEFKGVYNRAKDNAAGRKPAPMTRAKTQSGLDSTSGAHRPRPPRRPRLGARAHEGDTTWENGGRGVTVARVFHTVEVERRPRANSQLPHAAAGGPWAWPHHDTTPRGTSHSSRGSMAA